MKLNYNTASFRVCIDQKDNGRISGRVYSQRLERPLHFTDAGNFLLQIEDVLDRQNFPRSFQKKRTFASHDTPPVPEDLSQGKHYMSAEEVEENGLLATCILHVETRMNTSWQGFLIWVEKNQRENYFSALELLRILDKNL